MKQSVDIPLHDIMPLVEVPDTSIYWFGALVVVVLIIFTSGVIWFLKWKKSKKITQRELHYEALKNIDLKNPKQSAYTICKEGYFFAHDNERTLSAYQNLFDRLAPYKYAQTVEKIDEETLGYYHLYLGIIDV
jgi:cbb3-type cytochrome oxidase subunit 3